MKHGLRRLLLSTFNDTPFEFIARRAYAWLVQTEGGKYDRQTSRAMKRILNRNSNCVDVGCYRGDILSEMTRISTHGQLFAFEPIPENYQFLTRKFSKTRVFNIALSDRRGTATFYHVVGRPARSGLRRQRYPDPNEKVEEIAVRVDTLDNAIAKETPIHFIKIDVEGAELSVLRGGVELIKKDQPAIVFEHSLDAAQEYGSRPEEIYDLLSEECGLELSLMERWLTGKTPHTREGFCRTVYSRTEFYFFAYPSYLQNSII